MDVTVNGDADAASTMPHRAEMHRNFETLINFKSISFIDDRNVRQLSNQDADSDWRF